MATTITSTRAVSLYRLGMGPAPLMFPITGSISTTSLVTGQACRLVSGLIADMAAPNVIKGDVRAANLPNNTNAAPSLGLFEGTLTATSVSLDLYPVSIFLPHFIYEMNQAGTNSQALMGVAVITADDTLSSTTHILTATNATTTNGAVRPFGFSNSYDFQIRPFIGATSTTRTAGSAFTADPAKGVLGDTNVRVLCTVLDTACALQAN